VTPGTRSTRLCDHTAVYELSEDAPSRELRAGVPQKNDRKDRLGTISRLELFMTMNHVTADNAKWALKPLRAIRAARQKPAHALRTNVTDHTFIRKQRDLLHDVDEVLINVRQWQSNHPQNRDWKEPWPDAKDYPL
jgi:hypothetical protein